MWKGSRRDRVPVLNKAGLSRLLVLTKDKRARTKLSKSKVAQRRNKMRALRVSLIVVAIVSFFGGLSWLSFADFVTIQDINVEGNVSLKTKAIQAKILEHTSTPTLFLFSRQNSLLYPSSELEDILSFEFPKIKTIAIKARPTKRVAEVVITERAPDALWCTGSISTSTQACYYTDTSGYIFERSLKLLEGMIVFRGGLNESKANMLRAYIEPKYFAQVSEFLDALRALDLQPSNFSFEGNDARITFPSGLELRIALDKDLRAAAFNLAAVLRDNNLQENLESIKYIDMRFDGKVYYKSK